MKSLARQRGWISAAIGAVGGLLGGLMANRSREEVSEDQMRFQERMSSSAWQRGVADMQAAGLNPMLAYSQGPASSPVGAMPAVENIGLAAAQGASLGSSAAAAEAQAGRTAAETMPNQLLEKRLRQDLEIQQQTWLLTNHQQRKVWEEFKSASVDADVAQVTQDARTKAELAEFLRLATEAKLASEITESEFGTWLRYIDRALGALRGGSSVLRNAR